MENNGKKKRSTNIFASQPPKWRPTATMSARAKRVYGYKNNLCQNNNSSLKRNRTRLNVSNTLENLVIFGCFQNCVKLKNKLWLKLCQAHV